VSGQVHTPDALLPGKETPLPTEKEADWVPELVSTFFLEIKLIKICGNKTRNFNAVSTNKILLLFSLFSRIVYCNVADEHAAFIFKVATFVSCGCRSIQLLY
jgi:hypothetical protein